MNTDCRNDTDSSCYVCAGMYTMYLNKSADNLPPSCAVVTKSRNLNFPEPSGPVT